MTWITHDDITFEQAASPLLHKVILRGGPEVKRLLPCARTVRSWVMTTYNERISAGVLTNKQLHNFTIEVALFGKQTRPLVESNKQGIFVSRLARLVNC
jgi:hypothetical protein